MLYRTILGDASDWLEPCDYKITGIIRSVRVTASAWSDIRVRRVSCKNRTLELSLIDRSYNEVATLTTDRENSYVQMTITTAGTSLISAVVHTGVFTSNYDYNFDPKTTTPPALACGSVIVITKREDDADVPAAIINNTLVSVNENIPIMFDERYFIATEKDGNITLRLTQHAKTVLRAIDTDYAYTKDVVYTINGVSPDVTGAVQILLRNNLNGNVYSLKTDDGVVYNIDTDDTFASLMDSDSVVDTLTSVTTPANVRDQKELPLDCMYTIVTDEDGNKTYKRDMSILLKDDDGNDVLYETISNNKGLTLFKKSELHDGDIKVKDPNRHIDYARNTMLSNIDSTLV